MMREGTTHVPGCYCVCGTVAVHLMVSPALYIWKMSGTELLRRDRRSSTVIQSILYGSSVNSVASTHDTLLAICQKFSSLPE